MVVSEQIIQVIDALCAKLGIVVDWTNENVIPYMATLCEKLVNYEIGTSVAWMVIWLVLSIGGIVVVKKLISILKGKIEEDKRKSYYTPDYEIGIFFAIVGLVIVSSVAIVVIGHQIMDIIKCVTFPEMHIFEYIQRVINAA